MSEFILTFDEISKKIPIDIDQKDFISKSTNSIKDILSWKSSKKILIIWPCSADFEQSLYEYAKNISIFREEYWDKLEIVMRFYTWKPRTIWWWKGLINSFPWEKPDLNKWLLKTREIALNIIKKYKIPLADEMLYPDLSQRFQDIYSYMALWARSSENQFHREVASWLNIPIWIKNSTSWDIESMINSIKASRQPSVYNINSKIYNTSWNLYTHWILRWGRLGANVYNKILKNNINDIYNILKTKNSIEIQKDEIFELLKTDKSINIKNFDLIDMEFFYNYINKNWDNISFLVDCNHENSNKNHLEQIEVVKSVFKNLDILKNKWIDIYKYFKWFMVESYLYDWRQDFDSVNNCKKWLSLTDPCIWIKNTQKLIKEIYNSI